MQERCKHDVSCLQPSLVNKMKKCTLVKV
jgi:hypothetical protein